MSIDVKRNNSPYWRIDDLEKSLEFFWDLIVRKKQRIFVILSSRYFKEKANPFVHFLIDSKSISSSQKSTAWAGIHTRIRIGVYFKIIKCYDKNNIEIFKFKSVNHGNIMCQILENKSHDFQDFKKFTYEVFLKRLQDYNFNYTRHLNEEDLQDQEKLTISLFKSLYMNHQIPNLKIMNKHFLNYLDSSSGEKHQIRDQDTFEKYYRKFIDVFWSNIDTTRILQIFNYKTHVKEYQNTKKETNFSSHIEIKDHIYNHSANLTSRYNLKTAFSDENLVDYLHNLQILLKEYSKSWLAIIKIDDYSFWNNKASNLPLLISKNWNEIKIVLEIAKYFAIIDEDDFTETNQDIRKFHLSMQSKDFVSNLTSTTFKDFLENLKNLSFEYNENLYKQKFTFHEKLTLEILKVSFYCGWVELPDTLNSYLQEYLNDFDNDFKEVFNKNYATLLSDFWSSENWKQVSEVLQAKFSQQKEAPQMPPKEDSQTLSFNKDLKSEIVNLEQLLKVIVTRKVLIPKYQSDFFWDKSNIEKLLNIIFSSSKALESSQIVYLGQVVVYFNAQKNTFELLDGQQRIITLMFIIKIFYEEILVKKKMWIPFEANRSFYFVQQYFRDHTYKPFLKNLSIEEKETQLAHFLFQTSRTFSDENDEKNPIYLTKTKYSVNLYRQFLFVSEYLEKMQEKLPYDLNLFKSLQNILKNINFTLTSIQNIDPESLYKWLNKVS